MLDVTEGRDVLADVELFTGGLLAELAINVEPLTGTESFVVVMTFTDVVVVGGDGVVVVVVVEVVVEGVVGRTV